MHGRAMLDDVRAELQRVYARLAIAERERDEALDRLAVFEDRFGRPRDLRLLQIPGLTPLQSIVLSILSDGYVHHWGGIIDNLRVITRTTCGENDQLVRVVIAKTRRFLRGAGMPDAIETIPRAGYRIRREHLPAIRAMIDAALDNLRDPRP